MKVQLNLPTRLKEKEISKLAINNWEIDKVRQLKVTSEFFKELIIQFPSSSDSVNLTITTRSEAIGLGLNLLKPLIDRIDPSKNFFRIFSATRDELFEFSKFLTLKLPEKFKKYLVMNYIKKHGIPNFQLYKKLLLANLRSLGMREEDFLKKLNKLDIPDYWKEIYRMLLKL